MILPSFLFQIFQGHPGNLPAFRPAYGLHRIAEPVAASGLHLDKDQGSLLFGNYIDLAETGPIVPIDDPVTILRQMPAGYLLTMPSEAEVVQLLRPLFGGSPEPVYNFAYVFHRGHIP